MAKSRNRKGGRRSVENQRPAARAKNRAAAALAACVALAGAAAALWAPVRRAPAPPAPASAPAPQANLALSKEYVYAGGRLVATEEPGASPAGPPPAALSAAVATSSTTGTPVNVSWTQAAGASSYTVERGAWEAGQNRVVFTEVAANVTALSYDDPSAQAGQAYLYRARAVFPGGGRSDYSNADLATAVAFTDPQLQTGVAVKAAHLNELRRAVNAVRTLAGLGAASWSHPDPISSPPAQRRKVYLEDVTELRARLDEALSALGLARPYPSEPALARYAPVKAAHFEQIRERVR